MTKKQQRNLRMKNHKPTHSGPSAALSAAYRAKQQGDDVARKAALLDFGWYMWKASNK
jgi:hypothetical protein